MDVESWKKKFMYPFADLSGLKGSSEDVSMMMMDASTAENSVHELSSVIFQKLLSPTYQFPLETLHKREWVEELQSPISIQVDEIFRDLYKFIKEFPVNIIPHVTEEEE